MKSFLKHRYKDGTFRLAFTYLAIIMLLCITFSVIIYRTSTDGLDLEVKFPPPGATVHNNHNQPFKEGAAALNVQLHKQIAAVRANIIQQLLWLNIGALIVGGGISYFLARRTLRPIEAAMDAQGRFVADASHELRTPLTVMQSELDVTLSKPKLTLSRARAALESNRHEVARLQELSESLLQLTYDEVPHREPARLDELVGEAINRIFTLARNKDITITDRTLATTVEVNPQAIIQVFVILLDNALKYSPPHTKVRIDSHTANNWAYLSVRDEGPGIRASDLPHIFDRFYRADTSRSSQHHKGHGLGLSIAQKIVHQHGGDISVTSTPGKGTLFTIKLPL